MATFESILFNFLLLIVGYSNVADASELCYYLDNFETKTKFCDDDGANIGYCCNYDSHGVPKCCTNVALWGLWYWWFGVVFFLVVLLFICAGWCRYYRRYYRRQRFLEESRHLLGHSQVTVASVSSSITVQAAPKPSELPPSYQTVVSSNSNHYPASLESGAKVYS